MPPLITIPDVAVITIFRVRQHPEGQPRPHLPSASGCHLRHQFWRGECARKAAEA